MAASQHILLYARDIWPSSPAIEAEQLQTIASSCFRAYAGASDNDSLFESTPSGSRYTVLDPASYAIYNLVIAIGQVVEWQVLDNAVPGKGSQLFADYTSNITSFSTDSSTLIPGLSNYCRVYKWLKAQLQTRDIVYVDIWMLKAQYESLIGRMTEARKSLRRSMLGLASNLTA